MCRDLKALHLELRKRISLFRILSLARSMALDLIQRFDISFLVFSRVGSLSVCFFVIEDWWVVVIITNKVCISYSTFQFLWFISLCLYYHYLIPARNLKLIFTSNTCIFLSCMGLIFWFWSRGEISFEGWQILWNWISFVWFPGKLNEDKQFFFCNLPLILSSLSRKRKPNTNVQF